MGIKNGILRMQRVGFRRSTVILLALAVGLTTASTQIAFSEPSDELKLIIGNISLNPTPDGGYTANVNLYLRRANSPQINFSVAAIPQYADKPLNYGIVVPARFIRETIDMLPPLPEPESQPPQQQPDETGSIK